MNEIWRRSDPTELRGGARRPDDVSPTLFYTWWSFVLLFWVANYVFFLLMVIPPEFVAEISFLAAMIVAVSPLLLLSFLSFLTAGVVMGINRMQVGRLRLVQAAAHQAEEGESAIPDDDQPSIRP
jgi:hypothetical protein